MARPGGLADLLKTHAVAGRIEFLKVLDNFGPAGEFAIVTGTKAEDIFRRGDRLLRGRAG